VLITTETSIRPLMTEYSQRGTATVRTQARVERDTASALTVASTAA